jgi:hypothetical protein
MTLAGDQTLTLTHKTLTFFRPFDFSPPTDPMLFVAAPLVGFEIVGRKSQGKVNN